VGYIEVAELGKEDVVVYNNGLEVQLEVVATPL